MTKLSVVMHTGSAQVFGNDVDHLHNISVFKEQFALKAFAPLSFQECCTLSGTSGCLPSLVLQ